MRHQVRCKHLGRTSAHRIAMKRNMAASLIEHGTISTTKQKAKFVKPFVEKLITLAKDGSLHARRRAISLLQDRNICTVDDSGDPVKKGTVIGKLFSEIGPMFADRNGGYTRIINLPLRRVGDNGELVLLQLITEKVTPKVKAAAPKPEPVPVAAPAEDAQPADAEPQPEQAETEEQSSEEEKSE